MDLDDTIFEYGPTPPPLSPDEMGDNTETARLSGDTVMTDVTGMLVTIIEPGEERGDRDIIVGKSEGEHGHDSDGRVRGITVDDASKCNESNNNVELEEDEMEEQRGDGVLIHVPASVLSRRNSYVLGSFPWHTDIVMCPHLFTDVIPEDDWARPLAIKLDRYYGLLEESQLQEMVDLRAQVQAAPSNPACDPDRAVSNKLRSLLTAYRVLDVYVAVKGYRKNRDIVLHEKLRVEKRPTKYWDKLRNWHQILIDAKNSLHSVSHIIASPQPRPRENDNVFVSLSNSMKHIRQAGHGIKILENFIHAALYVAVLMDDNEDRIDIPNDEKMFDVMVAGLASGANPSRSANADSVGKA
ncbi:hypothetical protein CVT25_004367 [Psilocybe cyanescens]|uniref:Uncharacterized protein n=1 Tax=Psilocybe cyanescens TaxID=93625 RepID=A0A409XVX8_PSICY|nr:hypothetical protein CVT25_004367 [Psilocybe cyanescens]